MRLVIIGVAVPVGIWNFRRTDASANLILELRGKHLRNRNYAVRAADLLQTLFQATEKQRALRIIAFAPFGLRRRGRRAITTQNALLAFVTQPFAQTKGAEQRRRSEGRYR